MNIGKQLDLVKALKTKGKAELDNIKFKLKFLFFIDIKIKANFNKKHKKPIHLYKADRLGGGFSKLAYY